MDTLKAFFGSRTNLLGLFVSLLGAYLLFPPYFESVISPVPPSDTLWAAIDPSWVSALNYVNAKQMVWGNDVVFTYGPLSYLSTRAGWGQNSLPFVLFDLFYFLNFFIIFFTSFKKSNAKPLTALLIVVLGCMLPTYFGGANSFILLAFLLFWMRLSFTSNSLFNYLMQLIILTLLFFIKLNTGLICFVLFATVIGYKIATKKGNLLFLCACLLAPFFIIFGLSYFFNVSLLNYLRFGLDIVGGFNEIMYLPNENPDKKLLAIGVIFIAGSVLAYKAFVNRKEQLLKNLVVLFLFGTSVFILYKQAFVRADEPHILEFFSYAVLLVFCIYDFHVIKPVKFSATALISMYAICSYVLIQMNPSPVALDMKLSKSAYIEGYKNFTPTSGFKLFPNNNQLPLAIINKIGQNTIDSYPWNTQILLENKLNFHPRPVFQSYTAYTKSLEELNFKHYNSDNAPKYVLYDYLSTDNRYPLFDEPKLNLVLLKNYKCVDTLRVTNRLTLLLEKKSSLPIKLEKIKEYEMALNQPLLPKEGVYYEIEVYNSLKGKLVSILDHSPEIAIVAESMYGNRIGFKTSKGLLRSGLFSNYLILQTSDFLAIMNGDGSMENKKVKAYHFEPISGNFKDEIKITEYKITH